MNNNQYIQNHHFYDSEDDDSNECPLCTEEFDVTDKSFRPCKCGYQICVWCWHKIMEDSKRCPNCRRNYDSDNLDFTPPDPELIETEKNKKIKKRKPYSRKQLSNVRVIQRNLVYVVGLSLDIAPDDASLVQWLKRHENFGQYGKIMKIVINKNNLHHQGYPPSGSGLSLDSCSIHMNGGSGSGSTGGSTNLNNLNDLNAMNSSMSGNSNSSSSSTGVLAAIHASGSGITTVSAYITFLKKEDAYRAIQAVDDTWLDGKQLRASFGTTKYCAYFLRGIPCTNPECMYLHDYGNEEDTFNKEEIVLRNGLPVPLHKPIYEESDRPAKKHYWNWRNSNHAPAGEFDEDYGDEDIEEEEEPQEEEEVTVVANVLPNTNLNKNASILPATAQWAKQSDPVPIVQPVPTISSNSSNTAKKKKKQQQQKKAQKKTTNVSTTPRIATQPAIVAPEPVEANNAWSKVSILSEVIKPQKSSTASSSSKLNTVGETPVTVQATTTPTVDRVQTKTPPLKKETVVAQPKTVTAASSTTTTLSSTPSPSTPVSLSASTTTTTSSSTGTSNTVSSNRTSIESDTLTYDDLPPSSSADMTVDLSSLDFSEQSYLPGLDDDDDHEGLETDETFLVLSNTKSTATSIALSTTDIPQSIDAEDIAKGIIEEVVPSFAATVAAAATTVDATNATDAHAWNNPQSNADSVELNSLINLSVSGNEIPSMVHSKQPTSGTQPQNTLQQPPSQHANMPANTSNNNNNNNNSGMNNMGNMNHNGNTMNGPFGGMHNGGMNSWHQQYPQQMPQHQHGMNNFFHQPMFGGAHMQPFQPNMFFQGAAAATGDYPYMGNNNNNGYGLPSNDSWSAQQGMQQQQQQQQQAASVAASNRKTSRFQFAQYGEQPNDHHHHHGGNAGMNNNNNNNQGNGWFESGPASNSGGFGGGHPHHSMFNSFSNMQQQQQNGWGMHHSYGSQMPFTSSDLQQSFRALLPNVNINFSYQQEMQQLQQQQQQQQQQQYGGRTSVSPHMHQANMFESNLMPQQHQLQKQNVSDGWNKVPMNVPTNILMNGGGAKGMNYLHFNQQQQQQQQ